YPFIGGSYWIDEKPVGTGFTPMGQVPALQSLREALSHRISGLLKVPVEEIDTRTPFSEYGFDSITFTELANRLNQSYQLDLTPALFFEHSTLSRLAQYLHATYADLLAPYFPVDDSVGTEFAPVRMRVPPTGGQGLALSLRARKGLDAPPDT